MVVGLLNWFARNARDLPWRRTRDPYGIWVSEIMLQQTQVKTVIPFWERWMQRLPSLESLARARSQTIHKLWEGLGYYTRVRNMQKAARVIMRQHGGRFPNEYETVLALPRDWPLHRRRNLQHRFQSAEADRGWECHPRIDAAVWDQGRSQTKRN